MSLTCSQAMIFNRLREHRTKILALGVEQLGIFGSFARGEANHDSDVDILVTFAADQKTFDAFMELSSLLEEILDRPVELLTNQALSPYNRSRILNEVIYVDLTG